MRTVFLTGGLLLWLAACPARASADEDAAWIERYMQQHASAPRSARTVDTSIRFDQLSAHVGRTLHFGMADGRVRRGVLERADGQRARLKIRVNGGQFGFTVERAQVRWIRPERGG